ncbi:MAG TPA: MnhB domain-containing protein [Mycobacteriales bacterium]|nr:MnhB domain-containing protein [Mycobacteriales bacterium]
MSRTARMWLLGLGLIGVGVCYALAALDLPSFGSTFHPYRDMAVPAAVAHGAANAVTSIVFDQRGLDTLVEEIILFGSVIGAVALLRPSREEQEHGPSPMGRVLEPTRLLGYVMLPTTLVIGVDVVTHGHLTPGGGFQGGVILATGLHLLYVAGSYQALDRLRPVALFEHGEAIGAAGFAILGIAGILTSAAYLTNMLSYGTLGQMFSAGTVPILNAIVGVEVASGVIVLLARFFDQAVLLGHQRESISVPQPGELR